MLRIISVPKMSVYYAGLECPAFWYGSLSIFEGFMGPADAKKIRITSFGFPGG